MSSTKFEEYKAGFLEGTLSPQEEAVFRKLLAARTDPESRLLLKYFELGSHAATGNFSPVSKGDFFTSVDQLQKRARRRTYRAAVAVAAGLVIAWGSYWLLRSPERPPTRTITQAEIDRSFETTRLALNSFSVHLHAGMKSIDKGIDLSMPFKSLAKLKADLPDTNRESKTNQ